MVKQAWCGGSALQCVQSGGRGDGDRQLLPPGANIYRFRPRLLRSATGGNIHSNFERLRELGLNCNVSGSEAKVQCHVIELRKERRRHVEHTERLRFVSCPANPLYGIQFDVLDDALGVHRRRGKINCHRQPDVHLAVDESHGW